VRLTTATTIPINAATTGTQSQRVALVNSTGEDSDEGGIVAEGGAGGVAGSAACNVEETADESVGDIEGVSGPRRIDAAVVASKGLPSVGIPFSRNK
jgi:hypothetical protein